MVKLYLKSDKVERAFVSFDEGKRPINYHSPKEWYVLKTAKKPYPAKAIAALASKRIPCSFNTNDAKRELKELGYKIRSILSHDTFDKKIAKSNASSSAERIKRLKTAKTIPSTKLKYIWIYKRNSDVVAEVLYQAKGICQKCKKKAPFTRETGALKGQPYLEVHHKKQLAKGGKDTVENAIALCPNCHRKAHYG